MSGTYDYVLVALSCLVAVFASYVALDLAGRISSARGQARLIWLSGGALSLGIGIWSMHFIGMLAFMLPMPMSYDPPLVLLSLLVAVGASAGALTMMSRPLVRTGDLALGGPLVGAGIAAMHYIGMAAMRVEAAISYDAGLVALSLMIAVGASLAAFWLAFQFRADDIFSGSRLGLRLGSALAMGVAIAGMHYTGMAAAHFMPMGNTISPATGINALPLGIAIMGATLVILGFTLLASLFDRRFASQSFALAESAERYQSLFQYHSDAVLTYDLAGVLLDMNEAAVGIFGLGLESLRRDGLAGLLAPDDARRAAEHMRAALAGEPQAYDLALAGADGPARLLNARNVPIIVAGQIVGVYLIATDISARARATEALQASEGALRDLVDRQGRLLDVIQQLSTPMLPVHDHVLLLPLIGNLDSERSQQLLGRLLEGVQEHQARVVIIDITGVSLIDTAVARHLLQATSAARLIGAETVLVGVTPEVAQTIVQLGVDVGDLTIRRNLQAGVDYAIARQLA